MSVCPRLEVNLDKIQHNTEVLCTFGKSHNIDIAGVTKVFCGFPQIAEALIKGGVEILADSRIENLKKLKDTKLPKLLLRLPMISQAEDVVEYTDISLNSEVETIKELSNAALKANSVHKIILMIDLGDLREGLFPEDVLLAVEEVIQLKGVELMGIGTNLTCYGGVIPSIDNLGNLVSIAKQIESKFNIRLKVISGGNSSSLALIEKGDMPDRVNNLRLGESIVLGRETAYGEAINNTYQDAFTLIAEIIELKEKPSMPIGEIGMDAFGNKPTFEDKGIMKRAILAVGRQDVNPENINPEDESIEIVGASSDHLIVDITESNTEYRVGDEIRFNVEYGALLQLMTSEYIYKDIK